MQLESGSVVSERVETSGSERVALSEKHRDEQSAQG